MVNKGKKGKKNKKGDVENDVKYDEKDWCPCKNYEDDEEASVECEECLQWWHIKCVALHRLSEDTIKELKEWICPRCIIGKLGMGNSLVQETMKTEIAKAVPSIVKSVVEATVKAKEFQKTFAEAVTSRGEQIEKKIGTTVEKTMHSAIKENQQAMLQKASQKQDADNQERERRKRNVVVKNLRESTLTTSKAKYDSDVRKLEEVLQVDKKDIVKCYRAGARRESGEPRLLIVTLSSPILAEELHDYGAGTRVETSGGNGNRKDIWINQDLIKSDRDANYRARKLMREKRAKLVGKRLKGLNPTEEKPDEEIRAEEKSEDTEKQEKEEEEVKPDDSVSVVSEGGSFL